MLWMIATAAAAPNPNKVKPWIHEWYWQPRGNLRAVSVNGNTSAQAMLGAEVGLRYNHAPVKNKVRGKPDLVGRSRLRGDVAYGLLSQAFGFDIHLGSFIGPTSKYVTYQVGPDFWGNMYGSRTNTRDYHLPFSLGIDVPNTLIFHVVPQVNAQLGIIPGWAFDKDRRPQSNLGPFHELTGFVTVNVRVKGFSFTVGYQRVYNAAGTTDGLILSGGF